VLQTISNIPIIPIWHFQLLHPQYCSKSWCKITRLSIVVWYVPCSKITVISKYYIIRHRVVHSFWLKNINFFMVDIQIHFCAQILFRLEFRYTFFYLYIFQGGIYRKPYIYLFISGRIYNLPSGYLRSRVDAVCTFRWSTTTLVSTCHDGYIS